MSDKEFINDNILKLILNFNEQNYSLLEEILGDNKKLKNELKNVVALEAKICFLTKQLEEVKKSEKSYQEKLECKMGGIFDKINILKDYINDKINTLKDFTVSELTPIKITAAKEGAKYAIITSIIVSILVVLIETLIQKHFGK